jgi:magnesium-transporting ATPase (P-type)
MSQPPRRRNGRLLSGSLLSRAYLFLGMIEAAAAMIMFLYVLHRGGWAYGLRLPASAPLYKQATTACLATIVIMQIANVLLCRSTRPVLFKSRPSTNKLLAWGIATEVLVILAIVYMPLGNSIFETAFLPASSWLIMTALALVFLILEQFRKQLFAHRRSHHETSANRRNGLAAVRQRFQPATHW